jgi:hypothetical protein
MTAQLRRYRIQQGRVDQFATEWRYASAERQRLQPDPARLIDEARKDWLIAVS